MAVFKWIGIVLGSLLLLLVLLLTGGQFDDLLVELAGLDIGEALAALLGDREKSVYCSGLVDAINKAR